MKCLPDGFTNAPTFSVEFKWSQIPFQRMITAVKQVGELDPIIASRLLGHEMEDIVLDCDLPERYSVPGLPELNDSQVDAVKTVLQRPLGLIQGPPGTGKTVTSATIVYHLSQIHQQKVLVVAPSNTAVDQLCEKINRTGLNVVRVCARSREHLESPVSHLMLHTKMEKYVDEDDDDEYPWLKERTLPALHYFVVFLHKIPIIPLFTTLLGEILEDADVVCCTCVTAGDHRLNGLNFDSILNDESTQDTEPECLIPLVHRCSQVILVGDPSQLGPIVKCKKAAEAGLTRTLFERFVLLGIQPIRLQVKSVLL